MSKRRVVITGMGAVTPVGNSLEESWQAMVNGENGITKVSHFDASEFPCTFAGEVKNFDPSSRLSEKDARKMDRFMQLGLFCGDEAFVDSGLEVTEENAPRIGVYIGSGIGGINTIESTTELYKEKGYTAGLAILYPNDYNQYDFGKFVYHAWFTRAESIHGDSM